MQRDSSSAQSERKKAYVVPLNGTVTRDFLVWADSAAGAREIMRGNRADVLAMDDTYEETGLGRVTRMPSEDR